MRKNSELLELQAISYRENGEPLLNLSDLETPFLCEYRRKDSGLSSVLVRESIYKKLKNVQDILPSHLQLLVVEGYRPFSYQERYYLKELFAQINSSLSLSLNHLLAETHKFVALPSVAGHPTGGAIDLTIVSNGQEVDMGGQIADFSLPQLLPTYSPLINSEQLQWRRLLHDAMISQGFAPFYGEWWHFSYGDREWAAFYGKSATLYSPLFEI